jgi:PadR family transcriptional regulator PadR
VNNLSGKAFEEVERWNKEVKRGAVTLAILALLEKEHAYGYEIVKRLNEMGLDLLSLEQGTVYPLLRRLEKRGLLESQWDYTDKTKPRKYYQISQEGRIALTAMSRAWSNLSDEMDTILSGVEAR